LLAEGTGGAIDYKSGQQLISHPTGAKSYAHIAKNLAKNQITAVHGGTQREIALAAHKFQLEA
jgi:hypothetical protein